MAMSSGNAGFRVAVDPEEEKEEGSEEESFICSQHDPVANKRIFNHKASDMGILDALKGFTLEYPEFSEDYTGEVIEKVE